MVRHDDWTDTPPTEAGTYLFYGLRKAQLLDALRGSSGPRFEVLHVREDGRSLGHDFYPAGALWGYWYRLPEASNMEQSLRKIALAYLVDRVRSAITARDWYKGGFTVRMIVDQLGYNAEKAADEVVAEWVKLGWARQRAVPFIYDFTPEAPTE